MAMNRGGVQLLCLSRISYVTVTKRLRSVHGFVLFLFLLPFIVGTVFTLPIQDVDSVATLHVRRSPLPHPFPDKLIVVVTKSTGAFVELGHDLPKYMTAVARECNVDWIAQLWYEAL